MAVNIAPLAEAVAKLDKRSPLAVAMSSERLAALPLAIRERSQLSAQVESVRLLSTIQEKVRRRLALERETVGDGKTATVNRDSIIRDLRRVAQEEGLGRYGKAGLQDLQSVGRLALIVDMQTKMAQEYARWSIDNDADVLDQFPAQRLERIESRNEPRDWGERWQAAGNQVGWKGALREPMVALKTSPIWRALSRFGVPWPPFDYGSGMGLEDVDRDEAEDLGLLKRKQPVPTFGGGSDRLSFNTDLEASAQGLGPVFRGLLKRAGLTIDGDTVKP